MLIYTIVFGKKKCGLLNVTDFFFSSEKKTSGLVENKY
jgi:hypothetical protein